MREATYQTHGGQHRYLISRLLDEIGTSVRVAAEVAQRYPDDPAARELAARAFMLVDALKPNSAGVDIGRYARVVNGEITANAAARIKGWGSGHPAAQESGTCHRHHGAAGQTTP